jgi:type I restriction enzyme S subunit
MSWFELPLGELPINIIDGDRGKNYPKQNEFQEDGYCVFLSATNVTKIGFKFDAVQFIDEQKDSALRKGKLNRNDVVLTTRGTIGNSAFFNESIPYENMRINSGMVILRVDPDKFYAPFLYSYLRSQTFLKKVDSIRSGAAQPQLPIRDLVTVKIPCPDITEQIRASDFISSYDGLIENNRRRIQLLEESARLLYQEWFVNLRFPGHEQIKIVDGQPEGWEKKPLKQVATLNYGKALKAEVRVPGPFPVYGSSGEVGSHEKALVKGPAIVVGRKGNVGSVYWVNTDFYPIDTVYFISAEESSLFLYYALQNVQFINTDVAVPGLNRDMAYSREILIPDDKNYQLFLSEVKPIQEQINKLQDYNIKLAQARDLLLPKLMIGELTV